MVGQLNHCLLFVVNIGSEAESIKWYTIIILLKEPGQSNVQELLKGLGTTKCRACIECTNTKYYSKSVSSFQVCAAEPGRGAHFGVLDGLLLQTNQNDDSVYARHWPKCYQSIHQRLFMKKNKNHLERKVLPADLEHTCMDNKINIFEAENLGYVKI